MSVEELRKVFVYLREKLHMPDVSLHPQADIGPGQDSEEGGFHILTKCDDMIQAQEPVEDKPKVNTQSEDDGGTLLQYLETFCRSLQPDVDCNNLVQPDSICYDNAHNLQQLGIQEAQFDQPNAIPITKDDPGEKSIENCLREAVPEDDVQTKSQNNTEQPIMTLHDGLKVCTNQKQRDFQVEPAVIPVSPMCADLNSLNLTQEQQKVDVEEDLNIEIPSKFQHAVGDPFNTNQDIIDSQRHIPSYDKHVGSMTPATTPLEDKVINDILEMENDYSLKPYNKNITEKPAPSQTTPEQLMQVNANLIPLTVLHLEDLSDRDNCSPKPKRRCLRNKRKQGVRKC
ncbi:hypothetical protein LSH36_3g07028 [Paralvinella palmiformis]|uniref:Uncharacterized protein n=1 Tax=Paralvinella palmiformis TaxID=53620 RepID=A0AAD9KFL0_9ANNE|nr:hypothetical protein LSH36_3g07028 [Paralvinella palmiformis]